MQDLPSQGLPAPNVLQTSAWNPWNPISSLRTSGLEDLSDFPAFTFSLHVTNAAA